MMDQPTNPNTYLGLLASLGHRNANENGESATQMTQQEGQVPSALYQVLLQRKIEEEQARAAALLSLARNVSPDLLALALLRKQQQEQSAVQQLQEQFRILEAHQKAAAAPAIAAFGGEAGLGSLATFQHGVPTSMTAAGANPLSFPLPSAARMNSSMDESKKNAGAFPRKLHQMLLDLESSDQTHIASFVAGGRAFHIHQPKEFAEKIMPKYFRMGRFSSFQRQLNLYDFQRITDGKHKGGYFHEMFSRSNQVLATLMKRNKIKGKHQTKTQLMHMQRQQQIQHAVAMTQQGTAAALPHHSQKSHHLVSADASSTQLIDPEGDDDCSDASE